VATSQVSVSVRNVKEVQAFMRDQIADRDLKPATGDLRAGTKQIALELIIPELKRAAAQSGVPIAIAMADTARAKADRVVVVKIGAANPKLSGFRRGKDTKYRTGMAWGSEMGGGKYAVSRNESGYWVRPLMTSSGVFTKVKDAYAELLGRILADYGKYR
jgi:hypothetical protein